MSFVSSRPTCAVVRSCNVQASAGRVDSPPLQSLAALLAVVNLIAAFNPSTSGASLFLSTPTFLRSRSAQRDFHSSLIQTKLRHSLTQTQLRHRDLVLEALRHHAPMIFDGLSSQGYAVVDNFLPHATILAMREEAAALQRSGRMLPSLTKLYYDDGSTDVVQKPGVLSYGQTLHEDIEPHLAGFTDILKSHLPAFFNLRFPDMPLSSYRYGNKLTVTMGEGNDNPLHLDRTGETDTRKLTVILYLQSDWTPERGGCLRIFEATDPEVDLYAADLGTYVDLPPLGGSLIAFWSDTMPHTVLPTYAPSADSHRWAFTTWFPHDNARSRIERVGDDWNALYEEIELHCPHFTEKQLEESANAAFKHKFDCTVDEQIRKMKTQYGIGRSSA